MMRHLIACALLASCVGEVPEEDVDGIDTTVIESRRQRVIADVDYGGGVYLANKPGGYYMGRLLVGWSFDRHGAWYTSDANRSSYAWAMAYGHSSACLWVGPSRGVSDHPAGTWASSAGATEATRCSDALADWLRHDQNIGSHFNCPEPSNASNGTEKELLHDAFFYRNIIWSGPTGYDGGEPKDFVTILPKGTHVWYRYTTRDGAHIIVFVPGAGWGFMPASAVDRSRTGFWSRPEDPGTQIPCSS